MTGSCIGSSSRGLAVVLSLICVKPNGATPPVHPVRTEGHGGGPAESRGSVRRNQETLDRLMPDRHTRDRVACPLAQLQFPGPRTAP
jgi:hypothetical protein